MLLPFHRQESNALKQSQLKLGNKDRARMVELEITLGSFKLN